MDRANYVRILEPCKCTKCGFKGHNIDFENLVSGDLIKGKAPSLTSNKDIYSIMNNTEGEYQIIYQLIICPECKEKDSTDIKH